MASANTATNAQQQAQQFENRLRTLESELRQQGTSSSDPKAQALFETLAEVLGGAATALDHYRNRSEPAWR